MGILTAWAFSVALYSKIIQSNNISFVVEMCLLLTNDKTEGEERDGGHTSRHIGVIWCLVTVSLPCNGEQISGSACTI